MTPVALLEAPVKEVETAPRTPEEELRALEEELRALEEELRALEEEALRLGMSPDELTKIQAIGHCPDQVQTRIAMLRRWISSRLS